MRELHVGGGTTRGALTVFPVWGQFTSEIAWGVDGDAVQVGELGSGKQVDTLSVANLSSLPQLMFAGQLLEGGAQTRALAHSIALMPGSRSDVEVVCVEQGRLDAGTTHRVRGRRALRYDEESAGVTQW